MVGLPIAASVAPAVIALIGTLVGALIVSVTNLALARSKRRDEARAVARLVEDELQTAAAVVDEWRAIYPAKLPKRSRETLGTTAWSEGRGVLAYSLRRGRWDTVRDGYAEVGRLRRSLEDGATLLTDKDLQIARTKVIAARDALQSEGLGAQAATLAARARRAGARLIGVARPGGDRRRGQRGT